MRLFPEAARLFLAASSLFAAPVCPVADGAKPTVQELTVAAAGLAEKGQFPCAEELARRAIGMDPNEAQPYMVLARALGAVGQRTAAIGALKKATALAPREPGSFVALGRVLDEERRHAEAAEAFRNAVELAPGDTATRLALARAYVANGDYQTALPHIRKLTGFDAAYLEGAALHGMGRYPAAEAPLRIAMELAPRDAETLFLLGSTLYKDGRTEEALPLLRGALALNPAHGGAKRILENAAPAAITPVPAEALHQEGMAHVQAGDMAGAEVLFRRAIEVDPNRTAAYSDLGSALARQNKTAEAEKVFGELLVRNPSYAPAYLNLAMMRAAEGKLDEALVLARKATAVAPKDAQALQAVMAIAAKRGKPLEAIALYQELAAGNPDAAPIWLQLGGTLADVYDFPGALESTRKAMQLAPEAALAHFQLGRIHYDLGQYREAAAALEKASSLEPANPAAILLWGLAEMRQGRAAVARSLYNRLLELQPGSGEALFLLGLTHHLAGETETAVGYWQRAALAYPPHPEALEFLIPLQPGRAEMYRTQLAAWQQKLHATTKEEVKIGLAMTAGANLDWTRAIGHLRAAQQLCGKCRHSADIHKQLGLFYARTGDRQKAIGELTAAVEGKTKDPAAGAALELLRKPR